MSFSWSWYSRRSYFDINRVGGFGFEGIGEYIYSSNASLATFLYQYPWIPIEPVVYALADGIYAPYFHGN